MEQPGLFFRSVTTDQGRIFAVGDEASNNGITEIIDVHGATVFPGWVDAHLHIAGYGERLTVPQLAGLSKGREVLLALKKAFKGSPLLAQGYRELGLTASDLDQISPNVPILLRHTDYHGATVNSALLSKLNLQNRDGRLQEIEAAAAVAAMPRHSAQALESMVGEAIDALYRYGVTGGHSDDLAYFNGFQATLEAFEKTLRKKPFRAHLLIHHAVLDDFKASKRPWSHQHDRLQFGAVKVFYDGTLTSQTALLRHPYAGSSLNGVRVHTKEAFDTILKKVRSMGLPIALHVIGDLALHEVAESLTKYPVKKGLFDRIIHASFAGRDTLKLLCKLSLVIDAQPQFLTSDFPQGYSSFSKRPDLIYGWKSMRQAGLILCGGSDAPVETPNPLLAIDAAVHRRLSDGTIADPNERLTVFEALKMYTTDAQVPTMDATRGILQKGALADFTLLNGDPFQVPSEAIKNLAVVGTVVGEQFVFRK